MLLAASAANARQLVSDLAIVRSRPYGSAPFAHRSKRSRRTRSFTRSLGWHPCQRSRRIRCHRLSRNRPGMMGSAVARRLTSVGVQVRTLLAGRSAATVARAQAAGLTDGHTIKSPRRISSCLSCRRVRRGFGGEPSARDAGSDAQAGLCGLQRGKPGTVRRIDRVVRESGARFVDGGIIGPPPNRIPAGRGSTCPDRMPVTVAVLE